MLPDTTERVVPFRTEDGFECNVVNVQGRSRPTKGPVILVHGAGVRGNIFRAPVSGTIVSALLESGYDVWIENWRASIEFSPNHWNLDKAAAFDHPAAVQTVVRETGSATLKAIIHCQGSTSFMMSIAAGFLPQVSAVVSNAVALHPIVPSLSASKLRFVLPILKRMTKFLNPQWGLVAPTLTAKLVRLLVNITHHECDNAVCKQVSFTYGSGFPALWRHENLNAGTHEWIKQEFASVPMTFFEQMAQCVAHGSLVSVDGLPGLPADLTAQAPRTEARFSFFAGEKNLCFLPESQVRTYDFFDSFRAGYHALHLLPDYSHLDVFMGKDAHADVFPIMIAELDRTH